MYSRRFFIFTTIIFLTSGCRISENHSIFREGQTYQTTVESFVVFRYATFIWQNRHDYQKDGALYPFEYDSCLQSYQQQIKEKGAMEFKGVGWVSGGWAVYIPIGTKLKIISIFSIIPRIDKAVRVEAVFLDGPSVDKKVTLRYDFSEGKWLKLISF